jgi:hypothetical protein
LGKNPYQDQEYWKYSHSDASYSEF